MTFCTHCGGAVGEGVVFCGSCGVQVAGGRQPESTASSAQMVAVPPKMHWAVVLLVGIATLSVFWDIWLFVQWRFVKKIDPSNKSIIWLSLGLLFSMLTLISGDPRLSGVAGILYGVAMLKMRTSIEDYYRGQGVTLHLSKPLTFFFGIFYLQHHFTRLAGSSEATVLAAQVPAR